MHVQSTLNHDTRSHAATGPRNRSPSTGTAAALGAKRMGRARAGSNSMPEMTLHVNKEEDPSKPPVWRGFQDSPALQWERRVIMQRLQRVGNNGKGVFANIMWALGQLCSGEVLVAYFVSLYTLWDKHKYVARWCCHGTSPPKCAPRVALLDSGVDACMGSGWCVAGSSSSQCARGLVLTDPIRHACPHDTGAYL